MRRYLGSEYMFQPVGLGEEDLSPTELDVPPPVPFRLDYPVPLPLPHDPAAMPQRHRPREYRVTRNIGLQRLATALRRVPPTPAPAPANVRPPGGYECDFLDAPEDLHLLQTKCPICLLVLRRPCMVTCCCHKFCESCIRQVHDGRHRARRKPCPLCNSLHYSLVHEKDLERTLNGLLVHCPHRRDGCVWTGELGHLEQHLNESPSEGKLMQGCLYVPIACPYDCDTKLHRHTIQSHQQECAQRRHVCTYCKVHVSTYLEVKEKHWPECSCFPVACPNNCGQITTIPRGDMGRHLQACPQESVSCVFSHAGCSGKILRKKLAEHMKANMASHLSLLAQQNLRLMQELEECKGRLTALEGGGERGVCEMSVGAVGVQGRGSAAVESLTEITSSTAP